MNQTVPPIASAEPDLSGLEPVYFGQSRELFGCLHTPSTQARRGCAVLICPPIAAEHVRCHRPLRLLAEMLARDGFPVLRFDYFGTGNSLGDLEAGDVERWLDDIEEAVRYLRGRSRVMNVAMVGVRIGASLAARFHAERESMRQLVLWDPVVLGAHFVEQLREQGRGHTHWMAETHGERPAFVPTDGPLDLLGFRFSESLLKQLSSLSLLDPQRELRGSVLVLDDESSPATHAFVNGLRYHGADISHEQVEGPRVWMSEPHQGIVPQRSLHRVTEWLLEESG